MAVSTGILVILDGFGESPKREYNAILNAKAPNLGRIYRTYPHSLLQASEHHVGLPAGFMGNSEVGHLNIGAGRVVYQDFSLISKAITDGTFNSNPVLLDLIHKVKSEPGRSLHLMGLISDGGVHSHVSHLLAALELCKREGLKNVWIHVFTDGRDTSPVSGHKFVADVARFCKTLGVGKIATVQGRFIAMDRDNRWERTEKAYQVIVQGRGEGTFSEAEDWVGAQYAMNLTDEFMPSGVLEDYPGVKDGDGFWFINFRADRARQLTRALTQSEFLQFSRQFIPRLSGFVCMTPYDESLGLPAAYQKAKVELTLGEVVAAQGWKQLRIAETEKYAHVTYFFNGGDEKVFEGEKRVLIPSPRDVKTYDLKPEMSAAAVTDQLLQQLDTGDYKFVVVNFANPDMIGHTGIMPAAVQAVEVVDACLGRLLEWIEKHNAFAIITADHGNCETMQDDNGLPLTSHTLNPVPIIVVDPRKGATKSVASGGKLSDLAPTMLKLWGIKQPEIMTGHSLV